MFPLSMAQICILVLIGLPAAGKSSFCHWLFDQQLHTFDVIHLCFDNFISNIESDNESSYKQQRVEVLQMLLALVHNLRSEEASLVYLQNKSIPMKTAHSYSKQKLIICDDNHYYRSMRQHVYKICKDKCLAYAQIFFRCKLSDALIRNYNRTGTARLPNGILEQMHSRLEPPAPDQHIWEGNTLTLDAVQTVDSQALAIMHFLNSAFDHIPKLHDIDEKKSQIQTFSILHQLDLQLRQRIKQILEQNVDKQSIAQILNDKRKAILKKFRHTDHGNFKPQHSLDCIINKYVNMLYIE